MRSGHGAGHQAAPRGSELARELEAIDFCGVTLAVDPGGVLAKVAQGEADRANGIPNRPSTRFRMASASRLSLVPRRDPGRYVAPTGSSGTAPRRWSRAKTSSRSWWQNKTTTRSSSLPPRVSSVSRASVSLS